MYLRVQPPSLAVPQTERQFPEEVVNHAGGYVYEIDKWTRLKRFLVAGTCGGTYYVDQHALTEENAENVRACLDEDAARAVGMIVDVSRSGSALKQDYGLFALALAASQKDQVARGLAYLAIPGVCRTGSTWFQFLSYCVGRRRWSRGLKTAIARCYQETTVDRLAYQLVKYRQRHGFTHRQVMLLSHPGKPSLEQTDPTRAALYDWAIKAKKGNEFLPEFARLYEEAKTVSVDQRPGYAARLPWEAWPTAWQKDASCWTAALKNDHVSMTALIRKLGSLTHLGVIVPRSELAELVARQLSDRTRLRAARIHPIAIFLALKAYALGRSVSQDGLERARTAKTWAPVGEVLDALSAAFPRAFSNVRPMGGPVHVSIDASSSMCAAVLGLPNCSASEVAAAMASIHAHVEAPGDVTYSAFTQDRSFDGSGLIRGVRKGWEPIAVSADDTLERIMNRARDVMASHGDGTDLTMAVKAAEAAGKQRAIVIYTDNETWAGHGHLMPIFDDYCRRVGHGCRLILASTTATEFSAGDPARGVLQVCGFDAGAAGVMAGFVRGEI